MRYPDTVNLPFNSTAIKEFYRPPILGKPESTAKGFYAILQGGSIVVCENPDGLVLPEELPEEWLSTCGEPIYIGDWDGKPLRALKIGSKAVVTPPYYAEPFNAVKERLDDRLLSIGGLAHQILNWESHSRICSRCGKNAERISGTWGKRCSECGHERFPAIHPCVIVLVRRGNEFLLTRKATWPEGRYGLVAGFLDLGESLEECVFREVLEETGIEVKNIKYVGSQNWPFPSQLMAGFTADYAGGEIAVDLNELEDARWFSPEEMPDKIPPHRSIARWIIDRYALGQTSTKDIK